MASSLPSDEVQLEQTLRATIRDTFLSVPIIAAGLSRVSLRERFPDSEADDVALSTVPDPVTEDPWTSVIQIGIPVIEEEEYQNDLFTQLRFDYPITVDMQVVDEWADNGALQFNNSSDLLIAMYMQSRRRFKRNPDGTSNRTLGFNNCVHGFLQQEAVGTVQNDDETGGSLHVADWSLTIKVTGILN